MAVHRIDRAEARRIAVRAQLLDAPRPTDLVAVVRQLTLLQIDPTAAIAPSADLVAWSRLGASYQPAHLQQALEEDRTLFEHNATFRPMSDLGLYLADMAAWPSRERHREWLRSNDRFRRDILDLLGASGPLLSRDIPDTSTVAWQSTGWTNDRNVTQMLEFLMMRGEVAIAGRQGRQRLWDLGERIYPAETTVVPAEDAARLRNERRLRSLGIARASATLVPVEPVHVGDAGEPATVEGIPGTWRVDPDAIGQPFHGRTALLSPFDRLMYERARPRPVRLRIRAGDVQAGGQQALGLLRAPRAARRSARGQGGRDGRSKALEVGRARRPRGCSVHIGHRRWRRCRDRSARVVVGPWVRRPRAPRANNWTFFGVPTAQVIAAVTVLGALTILVARHRGRLAEPADLTPADRS